VFTPAWASFVVRWAISADSASSAATPYSRSDWIPTMRACGIQVGSRSVGAKSVNDIPCLKSSRYSASSSGG
jgi:hypothetical protein